MRQGALLSGAPKLHKRSMPARGAEGTGSHRRSSYRPESGREELGHGRDLGGRAVVEELGGSAGVQLTWELEIFVV
jgi:hypothetical protein